MKRIFLIFGLISCIFLTRNVFGQLDTYSTSGGELIFSWGDMQLTEAYQTAYPQASISGQPVRFTAFFHIQQFLHFDFTNNVGLFTGVGLRNIGMISNEVLPVNYQDPNPTYFSAKVIRRTYSLGIPLAIKVGSFKDNLSFYTGAEIEWAFHMKEKWWDSHSRSGTKTKTTTWWPNQITTFLPSAFVGMQFPGGVNLKFKYYLKNFLNHGYDRYQDATTSSHVVSDLTKYEKSQLFYVSLAFHFRTAKIVKELDSHDSVASIY